MRRTLTYCLFIPLAVGCEKTDPLYCAMHASDPACSAADAAIIDTVSSDAGPDAPPRLCYGAGTYAFCLPTAPVTPLVLPDNTLINTDTDTRCKAAPAQWLAAGQPPACFIEASSINMINVSVSGMKPLVLVAANTITIDGTLDVASRRDPLKIGPGSPWIDCPAFVSAPQGDPDDGNSGGAGGGAGASFMTAGRNGGPGDQANNPGGTAFPMAAMGPVTLRAGCAGQSGGTGDGSNGGVGGAGGGAVFVVAGNAITFGAAGAINASGSGATEPGDQAGGGGGGSGGMVVLYSNAISAAAGARIIANGGGGSSGANNGGGVPGGDPALASPTTPAVQVGSPCGGCGVGGAGFAGTTPATIGGDGDDGRSGGGGGGGGGFIVANKPLTNIVTSPAATITP